MQTCMRAIWLTSLRFCCSDNYLEEQGAQILADALRENSTITELSLKGNDLGDAGIGRICEALLKRKCRIKTLDLGNNK